MILKNDYDKLPSVGIPQPVMIKYREREIYRETERQGEGERER